MNILIVDDEQRAVNKLVRVISTNRPENNLFAYTSPLEALEFAKDNEIDMAFLDMEMGQMHGIDLGKKLKELYPKLHLVYVTAYDQYAISAIKIRVGGYLLKPAREEDILAELDFAYENMAFLGKKNIRIQCFGGFEVFDKSGERIVFHRAKSKELLAYLVDKHGASASTAEIAGVLCEDRPFDSTTQSMIRKYVSEMMQTLKAAGAENIISRSKNAISVNEENFECDYYNYLLGDVHAMNAYKGDYMIDYSWAEFTNGSLFE